jgi:hypothetical protein
MWKAEMMFSSIRKSPQYPLCPLLLADGSQLDVSFASLFDFFKMLDLLG